MSDRGWTLVTGATGYVGGRLVGYLLEAGHEVRVLVRDAAKLAHTDWRSRVDIVEGDALDPVALASAMRRSAASRSLPCCSECSR